MLLALDTTEARVLWNKFKNIGRERVGSENVYNNNNNSILQGCIIATEYVISINSIKLSQKIIKNNNNNDEKMKRTIKQKCVQGY